MSLCDATASKNDLFAQPQALNFGEQSDPFDVLAKHSTSEACIKKICGNPITLVSSTAVRSVPSAYTQKNKQILA